MAKNNDRLARELHEGHPSDEGAPKRYRKFAGLSVGERKEVNEKMHSLAKSKALEAKKGEGMYSDKSMKKFSGAMKNKYKASGHYHATYNPKGKKND